MSSRSIVRPPAGAGKFYPADPETLRRDVEGYLSPAVEKIPALGCVVPHAGYMYSGHVAGAVYARLELPKRYIILCPNHTGVGEPRAIGGEGRLPTPLGNVVIDTPFAKALMSRFPLLSEDEIAHRCEHA